MNVILAPPSFWPEPRDPGAWQRALQLLAALEPLPDPRPCWERLLGNVLSRRSVSGMYGLRCAPEPTVLLGTGLLRHTPEGWLLDDAGKELLDQSPSNFPLALASLLIRRSAWVRLALLRLHAGSWWFPRGAGVLSARRQIRVGEDLAVAEQSLAKLLEAKLLLGDFAVPLAKSISTAASPKSLSALHAPLYLLHAVGWLDNKGRPKLPDELAQSLGLETPAAILRRVSAELADSAGFVPLEKIALRLWQGLNGKGRPLDLAGWLDQVIGGAIELGSIEVHAWAPGQPRHGRGLFGDRERKLARWTVHDDFSIKSREALRSQKLYPRRGESNE
ncbi:hypothetical protein KI809_11450 [Geobacter pelophilus]|uniref:Winged helix DNA-binding domain-containing protein n=1 Tax=Geoanaerobacter pelophilus TaxID=60036 RepID=A0AAW4LCM0_9BACT|nr:hypothetical protein [Geoanaerobacter pelophilus]MBT0664916.1 hypothetical protein [Geoanaerobacter pelophilus]